MVIRAKYAGTCRKCGGAIKVGEDWPPPEMLAYLADLLDEGEMMTTILFDGVAVLVESGETARVSPGGVVCPGTGARRIDLFPGYVVPRGHVLRVFWSDGSDRGESVLRPGTEVVGIRHGSADTPGRIEYRKAAVTA